MHMEKFYFHSGFLKTLGFLSHEGTGENNLPYLQRKYLDDLHIGLSQHFLFF